MTTNSSRVLVTLPLLLGLAAPAAAQFTVTLVEPFDGCVSATPGIPDRNERFTLVVTLRNDHPEDRWAVRGTATASDPRINVGITTAPEPNTQQAVIATLMRPGDFAKFRMTFSVPPVPGFPLCTPATMIGVNLLPATRE